MRSKKIEPGFLFISKSYLPTENLKVIGPLTFKLLTSIVFTGDGSVRVFVTSHGKIWRPIENGTLKWKGQSTVLNIVIGLEKPQYV